MFSPVERLTAALADRYRIERELGAGGMATVYLAEDLKHHRKVAVKVLHPELAAVLGAERFLAEIQTTANLQHPHILPLHDSGQADGLLFYVMPFVEGETLRARLTREQQLPIDEAVRITREVASALDYAHRHGVIHRDIKPENILLHEGQALIADFGIALAVSTAGGQRMTQTGISLGTPEYMSPEQALGERTVTAKSDVYALGCVLYEMLTGEPPFTGATVQAVVTRVLNEEPRPIHQVRKMVPEHVEAATLHALAKLPADRPGSAAEFAAALVDTGLAPHARAQRVHVPLAKAKALLVHPYQLLAAFVAGIALMTLTLAAWRLVRPLPASGSPVRFVVAPPDGYRLLESHPAVSPDGRTVVFVADSAGTSRLVVRDLGEASARILPGTEGAVADPSPPFFSPDGRWVAFVAGRKVKKIQLGDAGNVVDLAEFGGIEEVHGGAWGDDGWIVLGAGLARGLVRVREEGGPLTTLAEPSRDRGEISYHRPDILPGGRVILFALYSLNGWNVASLALDTKEAPRVLLPGATAVKYLSPGYLLYANAGGLFIVRFDAERLRVVGPEQLIASHLPLIDWASGLFPSFGVGKGTLGMLTQAPDERRSVARWTQRLVILNREGGAQLVADGTGGSVQWSPTGTQLATYDSLQITTFDLNRGGLRNRLTSGPARVYPVYTPDGSRIAHTSYQSGGGDLYWVATHGGAAPELLLTSERRKYPESFSPDGKFLTYREYDPVTADDIWILPVEGERKPRPVVRTPFREWGSAISPDGKVLAFVSNQSGRAEVYIQRFPESDGSERVSLNGGEAVHWRPGGRELFFREGGSIMSSLISDGPNGLRAGVPQRVLDVRVSAFDVSPDGKRFAALISSETPPKRFLMVTTNWDPTIVHGK